MTSRALDKNLAYRIEDSIGDPVVAVTSFTASYAIECGLLEAKQASLENANFRYRPDIVHQRVNGLESGEAPLRKYLHMSPNTTATGSAATAFDLAVYGQCAWGGVSYGYAAALLGNTGSVLQLATGASNFVQGDWLWLGDTSDGTQAIWEPYEVQYVDTDNNTLLLDRTPPFTVASDDVGQADVCVFYNPSAYGDISDSDNITLSFYMVGENSGVEANGCKLNMTFPVLAQGTLPEANFNILYRNFWRTTGSLGAISGTPSGEAPVVAAYGQYTTFKMADIGSSMANVTIESVEPVAGLVNAPYAGVNATHAYHGYVGFDDGNTGFNVVMPYDNDYHEEFKAGTNKHALAVVGGEFAFDCASLQYMEDPARQESQNIESMTLMLRAVTRAEAASGSLGEDDAAKWRSPIRLHFRSSNA